MVSIRKSHSGTMAKVLNLSKGFFKHRHPVFKLGRQAFVQDGISRPMIDSRPNDLRLCLDDLQMS